ncbi:type IV pilin protein [Pseudomonas sp. PDM13]|uniref:type IV pilin protein n=1 Tax=Pseudomonas sp. PDM13 TaxID=2769255 RepID=UPI0021E057AA|nr:type IV pilin protein [Pseudomonas sp. PDM13]MCU9949163.1 type IV pilin protein [Pseudomonas sp. PDM13]
MKRAAHIGGFTLLEMLIAMVILAILASIALPSYLSYVLRSNRSEAQALLSEAASRQERYFTQNNSYASTAAALNMTSYVANLKSYSLSISNVGAATYTLTATAIGSQVKDKDCKTLTLDQAGAKGYSGTAASASTCWP